MDFADNSRLSAETLRAVFGATSRSLSVKSSTSGAAGRTAKTYFQRKFDAFDKAGARETKWDELPCYSGQMFFNVLPTDLKALMRCIKVCGQELTVIP
jgi:hypothetical protein